MYSNELICNILNYLNSNLNQKISIDDISKKFNFNKAYIMRLFKKEIGITITTYLNKRKIYNSLKEFKDKNNTFLKIALKNGFYNQEYFSETFKNIMEITPREYKKFLFRKNNCNKEKTKLILKKIIEMEEWNEKIAYYLKNKKPLILVKIKKIY